MNPITPEARTALEAAAFRRLISHLQQRTDVQNIALMNLSGFCRNCLSNWMQEAAQDAGVELSREEARQHVYGMPYPEWKALYQRDASQAQQSEFEQGVPHKHG